MSPTATQSCVLDLAQAGCAKPFQLSQALLDSPASAREARLGASLEAAVTPQPPAAVTPMTRGADLTFPEHEGGGGAKGSPTPASRNVSPKVRAQQPSISPHPKLTLATSNV